MFSSSFLGKLVFLNVFRYNFKQPQVRQSRATSFKTKFEQMGPTACFCHWWIHWQWRKSFRVKLLRKRDRKRFTACWVDNLRYCKFFAELIFLKTFIRFRKVWKMFIVPQKQHRIRHTRSCLNQSERSSRATGNLQNSPTRRPRREFQKNQPSRKTCIFQSIRYWRRFSLAAYIRLEKHKGMIFFRDGFCFMADDSFTQSEKRLKKQWRPEDWRLLADRQSPHQRPCWQL